MVVNIMELDPDIVPLPCACKGIRTCVVCEAKGKVPYTSEQLDSKVYHYCQDCGLAWTSQGPHPDHHGNSINFPGIYIQEEFVSTEEEKAIAEEIYKAPFTDSQSGRRKQDFGPKVNFKKKKLKTDCFTGLPRFSQQMYERMLTVAILSDFVPVEQCHLEYTPDRGSAIDPHFDDFWLWGERLVTVNLNSDTVLYFTCDKYPETEVRVTMNRRSLIVVFGTARFEWKHGIHRADITDTRLAVTLRELSPEFCTGGPRSAEGQALIETALTFSGVAVGTQHVPSPESRVS